MIFKSFLLLTFVAVSCGKYETPGNSQRLGKSLEITALTNADKENLQKVCGSIAQKELLLPQSVGSSLIFNTVQTDCSGTVTSQLDTEVVIQTGNGYVFKKKSDSLDYIFPNVETQNSGIFQSVCSMIGTGSISNPISVLGVAANVVANGVSSADCPPATGEYCVQFNITDGQGKVTSKEWIRFRVNSNSGKEGYFTYRKKIIQGICPDNQYVTYRATLK